MSLCRSRHNRENPFVQLHKETVRNPNLSFKAKGILLYCMSFPDDWKFNVNQMASCSLDGKKAIYSGINELIKHGYCIRLEGWERGEDGKFNTKVIEYVFFEYPATEEDKKKEMEIFKKRFRQSRYGDLRNGDLRKEPILIMKDKKNEETDTVYTREKFSSFPSSQELEAIEAEPIPKPIPDKKPRRSKFSKEYSSEVKEFAQKMVNIIQSKSKTYRPPTDMSHFYEDVRVMLEDDHQDPLFLLKVFEWGVNDNIKTDRFGGWSSVLCSNGSKKKPTTPASLLQQHASRLEESMKASTKEKNDRRTVGIDGKPMEKPYLQGLF